jgi:hypothetical protein
MENNVSIPAPSRYRKDAKAANKTQRMQGMVIYQPFGTFNTVSDISNPRFTSKWHKNPFGNIIDKLRCN